MRSRALHLATLATEAIGDFVVVVHTKQAPADDEWNKNVAYQTAIPSERARLLVWTDGGAPNASQRASLKVALNGGKPRTAIVTTSRVARAIATAFSWFNPHVQVYSPDETEAALDHLGAKGGIRRRLLATMDRLRVDLQQAALERDAG